MSVYNLTSPSTTVCALCTKSLLLSAVKLKTSMSDICADLKTKQKVAHYKFFAEPLPSFFSGPADRKKHFNFFWLSVLTVLQIIADTEMSWKDELEG